MRQLFFATVLACLGLSEPCAAWAQGAVYAMTNALGQNQIVVWSRAENGTLTPLQTINTAGGGSGTQLDSTDSYGSQGSLLVDQLHHRLFAVNAESLSTNVVGASVDTGHDCQIGSISSFSIAANGSLAFVEKIASGGLYPDSLTLHGDQLYVLNAGGPGLVPACNISPNITGFRVRDNAEVTSIPGSTRSIDPGPLNGTGTFLNCDPGGFPTAQFDCGLNPPAFPRSPAQIGFTPDGSALVVTVKGTNAIYVFPFDHKDDFEEQENEGHGNDGPGTPAIWKAPGPTQPTYFGFSFDSAGHLLVTEPFGTTTKIPFAPAGAVSSFAIGRRGTLQPISIDVADAQGLACWIALDPITNRYAYISNNGSGTISSYSIGMSGGLKLVNASAGTGASRPNDMAVAQDHGKSFLYALDAGSGLVGMFQINSDGSMTSLGSVSGMPAVAGAQGLAAY